MRKTQILKNKPVYLGLSILELSKIVVYEFWCDYVKPKYCQKAKLCYMDKNSFIVHVKTDDIYKDIAEDVEKVIELMQDKLGKKMIKFFVGFSAKL